VKINSFGKNFDMKSGLKYLLLMTGLGLFSISPSYAEVTDSSYYGFTIKNEYLIKALPDSLYKYIYRDIGLWWSPLHTFSGNAANMILQPKANGCFCEKLADGGSVRHMTVIYAGPGKMLRLSGGLGPLQGMAVDAVMTIELKKTDDGTALTVTYSVGGYLKGGLAGFAPVVDRMLAEQFEGLKRFAEGR
jgi:uncharacterized protein YndB with AHSA1/START domain